MFKRALLFTLAAITVVNSAASVELCADILVIRPAKNASGHLSGFTGPKIPEDTPYIALGIEQPSDFVHHSQVHQRSDDSPGTEFRPTLSLTLTDFAQRMRHKLAHAVSTHYDCRGYGYDWEFWPHSRQKFAEHFERFLFQVIERTPNNKSSCLIRMGSTRLI